MITAGEFRKGITIELDGNVFVIVEFLHVKPGKGAAFVRTKLKNVMTGAVLERTFNRRKNIRLRILKEKKCSIFTRMAEFIISWTMKLTNSCR